MIVESKYLGMRYLGTTLRLENAELNQVASLAVPGCEASLEVIYPSNQSPALRLPSLYIKFQVVK